MREAGGLLMQYFCSPIFAHTCLLSHHITWKTHLLFFFFNQRLSTPMTISESYWPLAVTFSSSLSLYSHTEIVSLIQTKTEHRRQPDSPPNTSHVCMCALELNPAILGMIWKISMSSIWQRAGLNIPWN